MAPATDIKIEDTKLFSLYIHELWWLAHGIKTKTEKLFAETKVPQEGNAIQVSPELHSLIASVLSDAANLKKLLVTPSGRLNGETGRQSRLRKARTAALCEIVKGIRLTEMLNSKVRNTLEHFDEYLDEANLAISEAKTPPSPMAAYNMVLSRWEVFEPRVYPVRLYISAERKFYNMKWSVDLDAIGKEAEAVVERIASMPGFGAKEGPGGLMLHLA
jgi:hypothetical protein